MTLTVSNHAISRYINRVDPTADYDTARAALSSPAIQAAAEFGAEFVRLAGNHRVVIRDHTVVTILPPGNYRAQVCRHNLSPQASDRSNYRYAFNQGEPK